MKRLVKITVTVVMLGVCFFAVFFYCPELLLTPRNEVALQEIKNIEAAPSSDTYCFAYASDCRENMEVLSRLVTHVNADADVQWLIFGGDIVYNCDLKEYHNFIRETEALNIPMVVSPGNHEMRGLGPLLFRYYFGRPYFDFTFAKDQFILLNNSNEESFGRFQKRWLKKRVGLAENTYRHQFAFFHVPLFDDMRYTMRGDGIADKNPKEAEEVLTILKEANISHVFMSHLHGYYTGAWDGVPYTVSAGAGSPLHREPEEHSFFHYLKITVDQKNVHMEVVKI